MTEKIEQSEMKKINSIHPSFKLGRNPQIEQKHENSIS